MVTLVQVPGDEHFTQPCLLIFSLGSTSFWTVKFAIFSHLVATEEELYKKGPFILKLEEYIRAMAKSPVSLLNIERKSSIVSQLLEFVHCP